MSKNSLSASDSEKRLKSTAQTRSTSHILLVITLPLLSLLGFYTTLYLSSQPHALFPTIISTISSPSPMFLGTNFPLITKFTGFRLLDKQLSILVTFFAPVTDIKFDSGGDGGLWLFSIFGLGQFGGAWAVMCLEGLRLGNRGLLLTYVGTVGLIFQNISYTVTVPLWLTLHLLTSPIAKLLSVTNPNESLVDTLDLRILPFSIGIGYWVPSIMMGVPFANSNAHQIWIALWQAFPLWTVVAHWVLHAIGRKISSLTRASNEEKSRTVISPRDIYLKNAKHVYQFILTICTITNIPIQLVTILPSQILECISPTLARLGRGTWSGVFVPPFPSTKYRIEGLAEGVHIFLLWDLYVGSLAILLWAGLLYRNAVTGNGAEDSSPEDAKSAMSEGPRRGAGQKVMKRSALKMVGWLLASGPIGLVAVLLWQRDMIVGQKVKRGI